MLSASQRWTDSYPGACVGVLAMSGVANPESSPELEARKEALEVDLRAEFASLSRDQLKSHPQLASYTAYYKRFDKTYHVQHQLESVVFKGKPIPRGAALVEDMFIRDEVGVLSSIIYGPDHRTRIIPATARVLFTVYAPAGIPKQKVRDHLRDLKDFVLAVSPSAEVEHAEVVDAEPGR